MVVLLIQLKKGRNFECGDFQWLIVIFFLKNKFYQTCLSFLILKRNSLKGEIALIHCNLIPQSLDILVFRMLKFEKVMLNFS